MILKKDIETEPTVKVKEKTNKKTEEWIRKMRDLSNSVDSSEIDMNDEKTRYIMSK